MNAVETPAQDTAATATVIVLIENSYACGRESDSRETVPAPTTDEDLDEWFGEVVSELTGDGHPCGSREHALYEATIVEAPARPELVGQSHEWMG